MTTLTATVAPPASPFSRIAARLAEARARREAERTLSAMRHETRYDIGAEDMREPALTHIAHSHAQVIAMEMIFMGRR